MQELFHEVWEELAHCCQDQLHWTWNEEELYFQATCTCAKVHYLEPTDAVYSYEESDEEPDGY